MCPDKAYPSMEEIIGRAAHLKRSFGIALDLECLLVMGLYGQVTVIARLTAWRVPSEDDTALAWRSVRVTSRVNGHALNPYNSALLAGLTELERTLTKHVWEQIKLPV